MGWHPPLNAELFDLMNGGKLAEILQSCSKPPCLPDQNQAGLQMWKMPHTTHSHTTAKG